MDEAVVIFGKTARPGGVKTRLAPAVGPGVAAKLYEGFARDVMATAGRYRDSFGGAPPEVLVAWDGDPEDSLAEFGREKMGFELVEQGPGGLGRRLQQVFAECRGRGAKRIIAVGTDSPTLRVDHFRQARGRLETGHVVFGPAFDGGYYLVGVGDSRGDAPRGEQVIFDEIDWSTPQVLEQSWRRARRAGLLCELLEFWYDIDTFEDLRKARFHLLEVLAPRAAEVGRHTRRVLESLCIDWPES